MTNKMEEGERSIDVFKRDLGELTDALQELQGKLNTVNEKVHGMGQLYSSDCCRNSRTC
jgi:hypothetical protein